VLNLWPQPFRHSGKASSDWKIKIFQAKAKNFTGRLLNLSVRVAFKDLDHGRAIILKLNCYQLCAVVINYSSKCNGM